MYQLGYTGQFKKDLKRIKKRSAGDFEKLRQIVRLLETGGNYSVPTKHKPHILSGNFSNHWECHVSSDLLIIWLQDDDEKSVILVRAGSHSDLY